MLLYYEQCLPLKCFFWNEHILFNLHYFIIKQNSSPKAHVHTEYYTKYYLFVCYLSFIRTLLEYGDVLFDSSKELSNKVEDVPLEGTRIVIDGC